MTRTFIALELDHAQQRFLGAMISQGKQLLPDLRWVEPDGIHLTLAFLGELNAQELARATQATRAAAARSSQFTYSLSGLGTFGPPQQPRVLWMGISEPSGALKSAHAALTLALERQGFVTEKRPFAPHLTLARVKSTLNARQLQLLQGFLRDYQKATQSYQVTCFSLMKSELTHAHAHYTCLETCPF